MRCKNCGKELILTYNDSFSVWMFMWTHKDGMPRPPAIVCYPAEPTEGILTVMDTHEMNWVVYLLLCSDGTYYCGVTNNLDKRLSKHNKGKGAK
jgi:hypothetical protein